MEDNKYVFDEDMAVKFIRTQLSSEINEKYDDDEILYVIDIIWDYYEKKGLLSLNNSETYEESLDPEDLTEYVVKEVRKDKNLFVDIKDIGLIVKAELEYEESLEDFI